MESNKALWVAPEDMSHHCKYLATGGRGKTQLLNGDSEQEPKGPYTPTPVDVVNLGVEPLSYLARFKDNSSFYRECQDTIDAAMNEIEVGMGDYSFLMAKPYTTEDDIDLNVMLSKVHDTDFLTRLGSVSMSLRKDMLESHLNQHTGKYDGKWI